MPGDPDPARLEITAAKKNDQLRLAFGPGSLGVYVGTRPCPAEPEDLAGFQDGVEVDEFP